MKDLNILSLDLEMNQPSESIIQVGCIIGNLKTGNILEEYSAYIRVDEIIDPKIIKLTGITQNDVNWGIKLDEAYMDLKDLHKKYDCFRNCLTWGGGDCQELRKQLDFNKEHFLFGRRWIDAKTLFISYQFALGNPQQAGLAKALVKLGLQFQGKKHTAKDDALNTFIIYRELLKKFNIINERKDEKL